MTLEEYLDNICTIKDITRAQLVSDMQGRGVRVAPCHCTDYEMCKGWRFYYEEEFDSREEYLAQTQEVA